MSYGAHLYYETGIVYDLAPLPLRRLALSPGEYRLGENIPSIPVIKSRVTGRAVSIKKLYCNEFSRSHIQNKRCHL